MRFERIRNLSAHGQSGSMAYAASDASVGTQQRWHAYRGMTMKVGAPYGQHRQTKGPYDGFQPGRTA